MKKQEQKKDNTKGEIRQFESGATRDTASGKIEYHGFRHPLLEHSFGEYMNKHRIQSNGELRDSNNWWKGWDKEISLQSLCRHLADLEAIHAGYDVYKLKVDGVEKTEYVNKGFMPNGFGKHEFVSLDDCINAIKFNCNAYLLEHMKNEKQG
jgi:hypothetical protein